MKHQTEDYTLRALEKRITYLATDLNGLLSNLVNREINWPDDASKLSDLYDQLTITETAVNELADLFWECLVDNTGGN